MSVQIKPFLNRTVEPDRRRSTAEVEAATPYSYSIQARPVYSTYFTFAAHPGCPEYSTSSSVRESLAAASTKMSTDSHFYSYHAARNTLTFGRNSYDEYITRQNTAQQKVTQNFNRDFVSVGARPRSMISPATSSITHSNVVGQSAYASNIGQEHRLGQAPVAPASPSSGHAAAQKLPKKGVLGQRDERISDTITVRRPAASSSVPRTKAVVQQVPKKRTTAQRDEYNEDIIVVRDPVARASPRVPRRQGPPTTADIIDLTADEELPTGTTFSHDSNDEDVIELEPPAAEYHKGLRAFLHKPPRQVVTNSRPRKRQRQVQAVSQAAKTRAQLHNPRASAQARITRARNYPDALSARLHENLPVPDRDMALPERPQPSAVQKTTQVTTRTFARGVRLLTLLSPRSWWLLRLSFPVLSPLPGFSAWLLKFETRSIVICLFRRRPSVSETSGRSLLAGQGGAVATVTLALGVMTPLLTLTSCLCVARLLRRVSVCSIRRTHSFISFAIPKSCVVFSKSIASSFVLLPGAFPRLASTSRNMLIFCVTSPSNSSRTAVAPLMRNLWLLLSRRWPSRIFACTS